MKKKSAIFFAVVSKPVKYAAKNQTAQTSKQDDTGNINETIIISDQINFWTKGSFISCQEEARSGTLIEYNNVKQHIIRDVTFILNKIAEKSDKLYTISITNLAESWMHVRTKFDGDKVYNICNRVHGMLVVMVVLYGGALRMNFGPQWSYNVWISSTGTVWVIVQETLNLCTS
ncbi:Hypothetical predicted protein [Mytilus galloprovincialis]|uniref:Uncharacterized protein n=1 Tax=Mytilus galloprovincialis TaxID=29158 RepID=A0A8B6H9G4_MYTGA|nr:Hypothetical predicted protein [Mytilus galloprovincialis]